MNFVSISYIFTDIVFIVGYKDTLTMSSIFCIKLHGSMEGCTTASEKIEYSRITIVMRNQIFYKI